MDSFGRLSEIDDGQWPLVWQYDKCGRITQEHQGFSSQYFDYDPAGRLFRTRMPDGNILTYHYQGENVSQIDLNGQTLSSHQWEHGQEIRRHMGRFGELTCRHQFDERGRLRQQTLQLHQTLSKPIERRYDYNVVNELTQITDNYKGIKTFTYDLKSRIATASHKPYTGLTLSDKPSYDDVNGYRGYDEQFRFDGADNLLSHDMPLDSLKQFEVSHAKTSRQDDSLTPQDKAQHVEGQPAVKAIHANRLMLWADRHYQYDEFGNLIRERRGKRQHTEHCFTWDGQHRLIEFKKIRHYHDAHDPQFHETVVSCYRYTYDAFGRRISKTDMQTGDKTLFFWLGDKLLTECHADDANFHPSVVNNERDKANNYRCRSYVYTPDGHGFSPLAQINGRGRGGEIYYYCNDQLGTPQELVTAQGEIVWSAVYKSYGNLAIDYQTVPQPLRLPGQYFDEESGLHYNRYRYYDPHCARYISQDPIGLAGGENAYSYVANPITWIDPLGLNEVCPGTEAGKGTTGTTQAGNQILNYVDEPPFNPAGTTGAAQPWSIKGRVKYVQLPTKGKIRFIPAETYSPTNPLPRGPNNGYLDKFGNEWVKGPSRTAGQAFE